MKNETPKNLIELKELIDIKVKEGTKLTQISKNLKTFWLDLNTELFRIHPSQSIPESYYMLYHNIKEVPKCECGNQLKFYCFSQGYSKTCIAESCRRKVQMKSLKENNLEKYGVENTFQRSDVKDTIQESNIKNFGSIENYHKNKSDKSKKTVAQNLELNPNHIKDSRKKAKTTTLERHGVTSPLMLDKVHKKITSTYGEDYRSSPTYKEKVVSGLIKGGFNALSARCKIKKLTLLKYEKSKVELSCDICNSTLTMARSTINAKLIFLDVPCWSCSPIIRSNISKNQQEISNFLIDLGFNVCTSDRRLTKFEMDSYIEDLKINIEYNGTYYHSEIFTDEEYHLNKTKFLLENGILNYYVWEDDYNNPIKKTIIQSRIMLLLGIIKNKIHARKCIIKSISNKEAYNFCEENHLQGGLNKGEIISYGLFYNNELVQVMNFSPDKRFKKKMENIEERCPELLRFCTKLNTQINGGFNRLFKHFIKEYNPTQIFTFALIDFSPDFSKTVYHKNGFEYLGTSKDYTWVVKGIRQHRSKFIKKNLVNMKTYDKDKTEIEIMHEMKYYRIYGTGSHKFIWNKP